jgi:hypothetical protein
LLTKGETDLITFLKDYDAQTKNLKLEIMKVCWHMRGGISWQEALNLSPEERTIVSELVKQNMETTKKTGQPFF